MDLVFDLVFGFKRTRLLLFVATLASFLCRPEYPNRGGKPGHDGRMPDGCDSPVASGRNGAACGLGKEVMRSRRVNVHSNGFADFVALLEAQIALELRG